MSTPTKVVDVELTRPLTSIEGLADYRGVHALLRVHGTPVGQIWLPVTNADRSAALPASALGPYAPRIRRELVYHALARPIPDRGVDLAELLASGSDRPIRTAPGAGPLVTVAVCTRDRPADLERCLDGLRRIDYPRTDVLVVDNAPRSDATERLVRSRFPSVRYVRERRPGLNWARNRAVAEADGEIVAFTDDDVVVDPPWIDAFVRLFEETPEVMAATGLVAPYELETDAQLLFEQFGGFGQGFSRRWGKVDRRAGERAARRYGGTGAFGTGANMAFRRSLFRETGPFDPALDVGTATNGGGDLEFFFRVLKEGHTLVRDPRAVVRHRHREEYDALRRQIRTWGLGIAAYVVRSCRAYPDEWPGFLWMMYRWVGLRFLRRFAGNLRRRRFPQELLVDEVLGILLAPSRYRTARRAAAAIEAAMGSIPLPDPPRRAPASAGGVEGVVAGSMTGSTAGSMSGSTAAATGRSTTGATGESTSDSTAGATGAAVVTTGGRAASSGPVRAPARRRGSGGRRTEALLRSVDLEDGLPARIDAAHARRLEIDVLRRGRRLGRVTLEPAGRPVRSAELRDAIADALAPCAASLFRGLDSVDPAIRIPDLLGRR